MTTLVQIAADAAAANAAAVICRLSDRRRLFTTEAVLLYSEKRSDLSLCACSSLTAERLSRGKYSCYAKLTVSAVETFSLAKFLHGCR